MPLEIYTSGLDSFFDKGSEKVRSPHFTAKARAALPADVRKFVAAPPKPAAVRQQAEKAVAQNAAAVQKKAQATIAQHATSVQKQAASLIKAGAVPEVVRKEAQKALTKAAGDIQKQAETIVKQQTAAVRKQAEKVISQGASDVAQSIGLDQARKIVGDTFKNMGVPGNIPVVFPAELSAKGVADAAYSTGKRYAENQIQSAIGFHISLPKKLTVEEIGKSVAGLIPHDIQGLINTALSAGSELAASAVTSALVGAGVGSVIPGLGTLVGLGVALGFGALRGVLTDALTQSAEERNKSLRTCKTTLRSLGGKVVPTNLSPMELMPWLAAKQALVANALAKEGLCSKGEVPDFQRYLTLLAYQVFNAAKDTPQVLGLPQLERLVPLYAKAPKTLYKPGYAVQRGNAAGYIYGGISATTNSLGAKTAAVAGLLPSMQARRDALRALVAAAESVNKLPINALPGLRFNLATELSNAAVQYQFDPSSENKAWFVKLATYFAAYEKRAAAEQKKQNASASDSAARYAACQADPACRARDAAQQRSLT